MSSVIVNREKLSANNGDKVRRSGIEILKIIAIFIIVTSHVTQTLGNITVSQNGNYIVNLFNSTTDLSTLTLILFRHLGKLGNLIFFLCSAWFMLDVKRSKRQKLWGMVCDVFTISVLWMISMVAVLGFSNVGKYYVLYSFFPTFRGDYWFITAYILFSLIAPMLNMFLDKLDQKKHALIIVVMFTAYYIFGFFYELMGGFVFWWSTVYFVVSYFKKYGSNFCNSKKANIVTLLIGTLGWGGVILVTNILGLNFEFFYDKMLALNSNCNPFHFLIAFGAFNLLNRCTFKNRFINYVSSLTLLIYVIHENLLFREIGRPIIWGKIVETFGKNNLLIWDLVFVLLLFITSILVAAVYKATLHRLVIIVGNKVYLLLKKAVYKTSDFLILKTK